MKGLLPWLLLLLQVACVVSSDAQKVLKFRGDDDDATYPAEYDEFDDPTQKPPEMIALEKENREGPAERPGSKLVQAARSELRKIRRTPHERPFRPRSILEHAWDFVYNAMPRIQISGPPEDESQSWKVQFPLKEAVRLLEKAALQNNPDAIYYLADMNFHGNFSHPRNLQVAYGHYNTLASDYGNSTAQYMLGLYHATGIGNVVPVDQAKAMLYYTFAALQGNTKAEMAVAYRHAGAIATPKNCEAAVTYYKTVAEKAVNWYRTGPPGGKAWIMESYRIADELGGVYGEGASVSSAGLNAIKANPNSDVNAAIDDVIEYLDLMSQRGDYKASFNLGRIYYDGQRGLPRDLETAKRYFFLVAKRYWRKDGRIVENPKPGVEKIAARAAGFIGRMYLRGEGVEQSLEQAHRWFTRGISHGDAQSQYGLGLMKLHGYGNAPKNVGLATELFKSAAEQDFAPAQVEMGVLYLDQGSAEDVRIANNYFELAARYGHIEAYYYLAEMSHHGVGRDKTCAIALGYYKNVAEKAELLHSPWAEANQAYEEGDLETAFINYVIAAEQGYEKAQNNVAYMLDPLQSRVSVPELLGQAGVPTSIRGKSLHDGREGGLLDNARLALMYWTRSSKQSNIDSQVKMGDYYFYGVGADVDTQKAVQCYTSASDYSQSAQALWNLGWMHENGVGLNQDFHLAKRFYDQALEINEEAYLPVTLSLLRLRVRSAWNTLTHGPIHSIQDDPKPKKTWSLKEWVANFMKDDNNNHYYDNYAYDDDIYDDPMPGGDADPLNDEDLTDSLIIILLATSLVFLLYYRQVMQQRHRREEEENRRRQQQQQQQQRGVPGARQAPAPQQDNGGGGGGGMFPPQNHPDVNNWLAGGVGH